MLLICDVLLHCDGASATASSLAGAVAAGASWSISSATSLTSERAESAGASAEESTGADGASETVTLFSTGGEMSKADGWGGI